MYDAVRARNHAFTAPPQNSLELGSAKSYLRNRLCAPRPARKLDTAVWYSVLTRLLKLRQGWATLRLTCIALPFLASGERAGIPHRPLRRIRKLMPTFSIRAIAANQELFDWTARH